MAMNKKEKALVEDLKTYAALRHTADVKPDVPIPESLSQELSKGYLPVGHLSDMARVEPACSSSVHHGIGRQDKTSSQRPVELYSTRMLALRKLRYDAEQECARRLRRIDRMIEDEQARLDEADGAE